MFGRTWAVELCARYENVVYRRPASRQDSVQHGRLRRFARQCVRRAPVAFREIRGGQPAGYGVVSEARASISRYQFFYDG